MKNRNRPLPEHFVGRKFHRLKIVCVCRGDKRTIAIATCDCGKQWKGSLSRLIGGGVQSCGCRVVEVNVNRTTHGLTKTPEYRAWIAIKDRIYNSNNPAYSSYGGRGIEMAEEWRDSFQEFFRHVGLRPAARMSIDRIDNNRGYFPGNVRWATPREQAANRRSSRMIERDGLNLSLVDWCERLNIDYCSVQNRLRVGWSVERALTTKTTRAFYGTVFAKAPL